MPPLLRARAQPFSAAGRRCPLCPARGDVGRVVLAVDVGVDRQPVAREDQRVVPPEDPLEAPAAAAALGKDGRADLAVEE
eukprot:4793971-Lingulodinium_polyedra.AAC.2